MTGARAAGPFAVEAHRRAGQLRDTWHGCIAQLVEQLTLNQRVQGSSPCTPTNISMTYPNLSSTLYNLEGAVVQTRFT